MDKVNDIIDLYGLFDLVLFMFIGFSVLWIVGKIQKYIRARRRKKWKRKNIKL